MSTNCRHNNLLQRDGTSRQQRLLNALLPEYVAVDERKIDDLKEFVKAYARQIQFFRENGDPAGNWEAFFNKELDPDQQTEPHYALFLAFLQLFKIAQDDLNKITGKHLDFYYRDVLQLKERGPVADQVFSIFKLAKHVEQHLVEEGTQLKAGKDEAGNELIYKTNRDIVVNRAEVADLKALYKDLDGRLYKSPVADSADGKGAEIESSEGSWKTFGEPRGSWPEASREQAEVGFAFASPLLFLGEGDRDITITLRLKENNSNTLSEQLEGLDLSKAFKVRFSGAGKWIEPLEQVIEIPEGHLAAPVIEERIFNFLNSAVTWQDIAGSEPQLGPVLDDPESGFGSTSYGYDIGETTARKIMAHRDSSLGPAGFTSLDEIRAVEGVGPDKIRDLIHTFQNPNYTIVDPANHLITIKRLITKDQDPIVAYLQNEDVLTDPFDTEWPVVKITLDTAIDPYHYEALRGLVLESAEMQVQVCDARELIIQNDQSLLDPSKNFMPFGIRPEQGSNFYIGSREIFSKKLDRLKVNLTWHGLPDDATGFSGYYGGYTGGDSRSNESFTADVHLLHKKSWQPLQTKSASETNASLQLFEYEDGQLLPKAGLTITNLEALEQVSRDANLEPFDAYDTDIRKGFLRFYLSGSDFGHKDFQQSYSLAVMGALQPDGTFDVGDDGLPNEPYTPEVKEVTVNYRSSVQLEPGSEQPEQFFHVGVYGVGDQEESTVSFYNLVPAYADEGSLYVGVKNFTGGQTLSLLFQVAEGSADPDKEPQQISWSYLSGSNWIEFDDFDILSDSTNGLLTSGIINFDISKAATQQHTLMPAGLHWLRATVQKDSAAISDFISIQAQAVTATFDDQDNAPSHLEEPLPAETIAKLKKADSAIDEILQPFSSFGGKTKEEKSKFYTRVSERLRHKNRAITIWDYERLVLEEFPSVYKVKCLNHTRYTGSLTAYSEVAPGQVTLIVISNVSNKKAVDPLRPKTSLITLTEIAEFINGLNARGVELHVKNPIYEELQVSLNVKFYQGYDNGFYGKQLEDDLKAFLSPWAFAGSRELVFGGKIHKSIILNYVEERPYVDFVTCFELYHIIKNPATDELISRKKVDEALASTAVSILGSTGQMGQYGDHEITALETDDCECENNEVEPAAAIASVDDCGCPDQQYKS